MVFRRDVRNLLIVVVNVVAGATFLGDDRAAPAAACAISHGSAALLVPCTQFG